MHLSNIAFAILGLVPLATAANRWPKPWEVTYLDLISPSGLPGTLQWRTLNITISDPNDSTVSPASCVRQWHYDEPFNGTATCAAVPGGQWSFTVLPSGRNNSAVLADFNVQFELQRKGQRFVGTQEFITDSADGDGNLGGSCSGRHICTYWLKQENTPVKVSWARVYD